MPSKGLMVVIILFVGGMIVGLSRVDFTRDVPHYPPGLQELMGGGTPVAHGPGPRAGPVDPNGGRKPDQAKPDQTDPEPENTDEIRIRNVKLTKLSSDGTTPVTDPGDGTFVRIDINKEGVFRYGGFDLGDWSLLAMTIRKRLREVKDAHIVIVPDKMCPWQYVYWVTELVREAGAKKVGIGGYPDYDEAKTLLVEIVVALLPKDVEVAMPDGMEELGITISEKEGGKGATYQVYGQDAEGLADLFTLVSSFNGDYADEYGPEYTRDVSKSPWVVTAPGTMATGHVLVTLDAIRRAAVYTLRFGGEMPPPPGK